MAKFFVLLLVSASTFGAGFSHRLFAAGSSLGDLSFAASLGASTALAAAACGHLDALVFACGAVGGVAASALLPWSPAAAGAALGVAVFAERTLRVPGATKKALHLALASLAGAAAGLVCAHHAGAPALQQAAAAALAAALLSSPLMLAADDPLVHLLDLAASAVGAGSSSSLREASDLRRWAVKQPPPRGSGKLWSRLAEQVRRRAALPPLREPPQGASYRDDSRDEGPELRQARSLDAQIDDSLSALRRAFGQA